MEIGSIQVIVSVFLILAAAGVALCCDFLSRKNRRVGEATAKLELQSQREEEMPVDVLDTPTVTIATPPPLPVPVPAAAEQVPVEEAVPVAIDVEETVAAPNWQKRWRDERPKQWR